MRVVDLFAGAGGFSLGFVRAGCEIVAAYDFEPNAVAVHAANFPAVPRRGLRVAVPPGRPDRHVEADLTDLLSHAGDIAGLRPDVIVGGPPCQAFSSAGERLGDADPRARLTEAFAVLVATSRPRYFVMENVKQVQHARVYQRATDILRRAGYGLSAEEVDMSWYGVGQARERLLLFGSLGEADGWATAYLEAAKQPWQTTVRDILGESVGDAYFRMGHRGEGGRVSFRSADEPGVTVTTTADRRADGPEGYTVRASDAAFLDRHDLVFIYPGGSSSAGSRSIDAPAPTLTRRAADAPGPKYTPRKGDVIGVHDLPVLSLEQLAALGGYPSDWVWHTNPKRPLAKAAQMLMIANSVPSPMSETVARILQSHARGEPATHTLPAPMPVGIAQWLAGPGNVAREHVAQRLSEIRAALRLLNGRRVRDAHEAEERLRAMREFVALGRGRKSNLLAGMRLYHRYLVEVGPAPTVDDEIRAAEHADADFAPFPLRGFESLRRQADTEAAE